VGHEGQWSGAVRKRIGVDDGKLRDRSEIILGAWRPCPEGGYLFTAILNNIMVFGYPGWFFETKISQRVSL
jgi:hypothetical protein